MKNTPLVSIIIPIHNQVDFLKKAIESVLNQIYQNFEVIIVNDGSTDQTREMVFSFKDERVIYLWQENKGAALARNTGIEKAKGKYIAFLDADDLWLPEKLQKQVEFMEKNPEIGLLGTACVQVNEKGEKIKEKIFPTENKILQKDLIKYNPFIQSSVMVKKEVFDKAQGYDEEFLESEDYDLWLRIAKRHKITNLSEPLVLKTYYLKNLSSSKDKKQLTFAFKAKKNAILRRQYSKWFYFYLLLYWLFLKMPFFLRKIIRKIIKKPCL